MIRSAPGDLRRFVCNDRAIETRAFDLGVRCGQELFQILVTFRKTDGVANILEVDNIRVTCVGLVVALAYFPVISGLADRLSDRFRLLRLIIP
jgi:hypothetical protein